MPSIRVRVLSLVVCLATIFIILIQQQAAALVISSSLNTEEEKEKTSSSSLSSSSSTESFSIQQQKQQQRQVIEVNDNNENTNQQQRKQQEQEQRHLWAVHGALAAVAWGVLVPFAIAASFLRNALPGSPILEDPPAAATRRRHPYYYLIWWLSLHWRLNVVAILTMSVSFAFAVAAQTKYNRQNNNSNNTNNDDNNDEDHDHHYQHFVGTHPLVGLWLMTVLVIQMVCGVGRPRLLRPFPEQEDQVEKTKLRVIWEYGHRILGVLLLSTAFWQVHRGILLFAEKYDDHAATGGRRSGSLADYRISFWVWIGCLGLLMVLVKIRLK